MGMRLSRIGLLATVVALVAGVAAIATPSAKAGLLGCGSASQPFSGVDGDTASYYAMSNGGFESGSYGWSLGGGAGVVSGNEPWSVAGGTHSLSLPSGSAAAGPRTCIGLLSPTLRLFASDAGGTDRGLQITVEYRSLLGALLGVRSYTVLNPADFQSWQPTDPITIPLGTLGGIPLLTASFDVRVTPLGSGSNWRIDDVYVDPYVHGC